MNLGKVCLSSQMKWLPSSWGGCEIYDPGGIRTTFLNLRALKSEAVQPPWGSHLRDKNSVAAYRWPLGTSNCLPGSRLPDSCKHSLWSNRVSWAFCLPEAIGGCLAWTQGPLLGSTRRPVPSFLNHWEKLSPFPSLTRKHRKCHYWTQ